MKKEIDCSNINRKFRKLARTKFLNPHSCKTLAHTRTNIFELAKIIQHFKRKHNCIPESAFLLFYKYNTKQEALLFDEYKEKYLKD